MNYEELYEALQSGEKDLLDGIKSAMKNQKQIVKDADTGDVKDMRKAISAMAESLRKQMAALEQLKDLADSFDEKEYFSSGNFPEQMLEACRNAGVDTHGEYPVYEMFPYRVRIDSDNQDIWLDRKKVPCMRPSYFASLVKNGQEKLMKASFNASAFAEELAAAYDLALLKGGKREGSDMMLGTVYRFMVPMSRSRKEYDQQSFAFDIARLYMSEGNEIKDGRRFEFGPSRNNSKAIRILDQNGKEQYLATIRFI